MPVRVDRTQRNWYAMRDLSRRHSRRPCYRELAEQGYEVFTPMTRRIVVEQGRRRRVEEPYMQDLLFVHASREELDPAVEKLENLQYRYVRGGYCEPMVVAEGEMDRFIHAVRTSRLARYYRPEEITAQMCGKYVRIVGSALDGYEGYLLTVSGSKYRRLLVNLENYLTAAVEVSPEYVEILEKEVR